MPPCCCPPAGCLIACLLACLLASVLTGCPGQSCKMLILKLHLGVMLTLMYASAEMAGNRTQRGLVEVVDLEADPSMSPTVSCADLGRPWRLSSSQLNTRYNAPTSCAWNGAPAKAQPNASNCSARASWPHALL